MWDLMKISAFETCTLTSFFTLLYLFLFKYNVTNYKIQIFGGGAFFLFSMFMRYK